MRDRLIDSVCEKYQFPGMEKLSFFFFEREREFFKFNWMEFGRKNKRVFFFFFITSSPRSILRFALWQPRVKSLKKSLYRFESIKILLNKYISFLFYCIFISINSRERKKGRRETFFHRKTKIGLDFWLWNEYSNWQTIERVKYEKSRVRERVSLICEARLV